MDKKKFVLNKMREGFSDVESFVHRYMVEAMTVAAIVVAAFSAWVHLFVGTLGWAILFLVIGSVLGIFMPVQMDWMMKKIYSYSRGKGRVAAIVGEAVKIAVALFLPFLYFGFLGVMTGTAYQYYVHTSHSGHNKGNKAA